MHDRSRSAQPAPSAPVSGGLPLMSDPAVLRGVVMVMLAGGFWSLAGILIRLIEAADSWQILLIRSISVLATLFAVLLWRYRGQALVQVRRAGLNGMVGGASLAVAFTGFVFALNHTSVANAVFILSVAPMVTAVLAWLVLRETVRRATWWAIAVALVGIGVMVGDGIRAGALFGNLMALLAVFGFSGFAVALRRGREADMLPAACWAGLFAALVAATQVPSFALSLHDAAICTVMGVVQIGIGMVLFTAGSRHVPAAELALLSLTEVVLGPLWVWLGVGEVPRVLTLVGGAIVLVAVVGRAVTGLRRKPGPFGAV